MRSPTLRTALLVGFLLHAVLLAAAYFAGPLKTVATLLLLILALPGALIDMSAEVLHPRGIAIAALVLVACLVNGLAYAGLTALVLRLRRR